MEIHNPSSPRNYIEKGDFTLVAQTPTRIHKRSRRFRFLCDLHNIAYVSVICILLLHSSSSHRAELERIVSKKKCPRSKFDISGSVCVFFFSIFFFTFVQSVEIRKIRLKFFPFRFIVIFNLQMSKFFFKYK